MIQDKHKKLCEAAIGVFLFVQLAVSGWFLYRFVQVRGFFDISVLKYGINITLTVGAFLTWIAVRRRAFFNSLGVGTILLMVIIGVSSVFNQFALDDKTFRILGIFFGVSALWASLLMFHQQFWSSVTLEEIDVELDTALKHCNLDQAELDSISKVLIRSYPGYPAWVSRLLLWTGSVVVGICVSLLADRITIEIFPW